MWPVLFMWLPPSPFLSSFFCSLIFNMVSELQVERSYGWWEKILRVLQASETLKEYKSGEYWGCCRPLRLKKEYKSCRSASETRKRVQAAENICWFHSVVWNIFWVKEIVFLCSFWCMSIYLLYFCWSEHDSFWW